MNTVEQILAGLLLWVLHFLQTPEGQTILSETENELIAELEAFEANPGGTSPPPPAPTGQTAPSAPLRGRASAFANPRKVSSAVDEQSVTGE